MILKNYSNLMNNVPNFVFLLFHLFIFIAGRIHVFASSTAGNNNVNTTVGVCLDQLKAGNRYESNEL